MDSEEIFDECETEQKIFDSPHPNVTAVCSSDDRMTFGPNLERVDDLPVRAAVAAVLVSEGKGSDQRSSMLSLGASTLSYQWETHS